jgi:hypothetical protein
MQYANDKEVKDIRNEQGGFKKTDRQEVCLSQIAAKQAQGSGGRVNCCFNNEDVARAGGR